MGKQIENITKGALFTLEALDYLKKSEEALNKARNLMYPNDKDLAEEEELVHIGDTYKKAKDYIVELSAAFSAGSVPAVRDLVPNVVDPKAIPMRSIFAALTKELGEEEGKAVFEWYCSTYNVTISDIAPAAISREVLGI